MVETQSSEIETDADFEASLNDLIETAIDNGIDVRGGWQVDAPEAGTDLGVEIYDVSRLD